MKHNIKGHRVHLFSIYVNVLRKTKEEVNLSFTLLSVIVERTRMASEQDVTSDSLDTTVVDVPDDLLGYVKSSIVDYVNKAKDFSAKIHYVEGQSPKMVVSFGRNPGKLMILFKKER